MDKSVESVKSVKSVKSEKSLETLAQVRKALKEIDGLRNDREVSEEQRAELELAAVELRGAERALVGEYQDSLVEDLRLAAGNLGELAVQMRASLKKFNTASRVFTKIDSVAGYITSVVSAISKWY